MTTCNDIIRLLTEIKNSPGPTGAIYLSKKLNIPQATIGRMMTRLEADGLLEKLSNKGRIITQEGLDYLDEQSNRFSKEKAASKLIDIVENVSKDRLLEILEVRKQLEGRAIELACTNATPKDIEKLENILFDHAYDFKHGGLGCEEDLQLHLTIAKLSGNTTIYQILKLILTEDNAYTKFSVVADHVKSVQVSQHREIVDAIKNKDAKKAKDAMVKHLEQVALDVKLYVPD